MEQKRVKNPNWQENDQLSINKARRKCIRGYQRQIQLVALQVQRPNH